MKGLKAWSEKLRKQNMPVLGDVIVELNKISGSDEAEVSQLAEVILRDPKLTSHVLRVANSVQYNYSKDQINTVSRAIVLIGLKGMRAICISVMVMDHLVKDKPQERVLKLIAQGFHAATQARNLVSKFDEKAAEEVFIAALLFNLGEMAFWTSDEANYSNPNLLSDNARVRKEAMDDLLGTSFKAITRELAKHWKLGETLEKALYPQKENSSKVQAVIVGERLSRAAIYGWESPQLKKVLKEFADYSELDLEEALKLIKKGADQSAEIAQSYGVAEACPHIPSSIKAGVIPVTPPPSKILKGDAMLQLSILRELLGAANEGLDVNAIFQMVLEGMHRGIGLERVAIAFIQSRKLQAKYALGEGTEHWRQSFLIDIGPYSDSIFTQAIEKGGSVWMTPEKIKSSGNLYPEDVVRNVGKFPCFISVLELDKRKVGLFYADRWTYGGQLDQEQFESFKHFAMQTQINLSSLSGSKKGL